MVESIAYLSRRWYTTNTHLLDKGKQMSSKIQTVIVLVMITSPILGALVYPVYKEIKDLRKYNKRHSHPSMKNHRV